jgi:hypothetical protein
MTSTDIADVCETIIYGGGHTCANARDLKHTVSAAVIADFARSQFASLSKWHHTASNLRNAVGSKGWDLAYLPKKRWHSAAELLELEDSGRGEGGGKALARHMQGSKEKHVRRIKGQGAEHLEDYLSSATSADSNFYSKLNVTNDSDGKRRLDSVLVIPGMFAFRLFRHYLTRCVPDANLPTRGRRKRSLL